MMDTELQIYINQTKKHILTPLEIKFIRETFLMTQVEFCEFLNINFHTYTSWEIGRRRPSSAANTLLTLAKRDPKYFIKNKLNIIRNLKEFLY